MDKKEVIQMNILSLAFVGDAYFSLEVRKLLAIRYKAKAGSLHIYSNKYVKATSQAKMMAHIMPKLNDEEHDLVRRARNHHNNTKAKNAGLADYKKATELEAIFGYYVLIEDEERLEYLFNECIAFMDNLIIGVKSNE